MARALPQSVAPQDLARELGSRGELLVMCDYDGTLVPLAPTPEQVKPPPELLDVLDRLARAAGKAVAVISGRRLADLRKMLPVGGLFLAGCHGAELMEPGGKVELLTDPEIAAAIEDLEKRARECVAGHEGFLIENKSFSLALHYRLASPPVAAKVLKRFAGELKALPAGENLQLLWGKKVLEVRPRGVHKGKAVSYLRRKFPRAVPVYLGDDITDEDAFAASSEGFAVLVGERPRPSRARFHLASPRDVLAFLGYLAGCNLVTYGSTGNFF
ncbi:trehalose-phosphatase [Desulfovirgula thermocuniculi]|uniref:trehalose-phosphatase n=1 Tax=Desulfovirgula thermocuniculi TaxID=348842 RepID=UPI000400D11C|nr:trehalose-phosphatase [Desulfovirgula thermocuniculi]